MADVDVARTWSLQYQGFFWTGTGPAALIKGQYRVPVIGREIEWQNPTAREYWGGIVGDPRFTYPEPNTWGALPSPSDDYMPPLPRDDYPTATGPGDGPAAYCPSCGAPNLGSRYCPHCGNPYG